MGQDLSCMICGKYYNECKHYRKEHLPYYDVKKSICGRTNVCILDTDWYDRDINPNDICKDCAKQDMLFQSKFIWEFGEYRERDEDEKYIMTYTD